MSHSRSPVTIDLLLLWKSTKPHESTRSSNHRLLETQPKQKSQSTMAVVPNFMVLRRKSAPNHLHRTSTAPNGDAPAKATSQGFVYRRNRHASLHYTHLSPTRSEATRATLCTTQRDACTKQRHEGPQIGDGPDRPRARSIGWSPSLRSHPAGAQL